MTSQLAKQESHEITTQEEFKPTPHMIVWLDTALRLMTDNITEIEKESHIAANTWYTWIKDENFRLWFKTNWDKRLAGESWKLDVIGMKQARRDHKYWQDMQRRVGNFGTDSGNTQATQVNISVGGHEDTNIEL